MLEKLTLKSLVRDLALSVGSFIFAGALVIPLLNQDVSQFREKINYVCSKVDYCCPENVASFSEDDLNRDGFDDYVLFLRDGSELVYLGNKTYTLQEQ